VAKVAQLKSRQQPGRTAPIPGLSSSNSAFATIDTGPTAEVPAF
jgi:hypothetical protein